jgi:hypothetical protein
VNRPVLIAAGLFLATACASGSAAHPAATAGAGPTEQTTPAAHATTTTSSTMAAPAPTATSSSTSQPPVGHPDAGPASTGSTGTASPTPPGQYVFDRTGSGSYTGCGAGTQPDNGTTILTITAPSADQRREVQDERDAAGQGDVTTTTYDFAGPEVRLAALVVTDYYQGGQQTYSFTPSDPPVVLQTPLTAGDHWSYQLTSSNATLSGTDSVSSVGQQTQLADGQPETVDLVQIDATLTTTVFGAPVRVQIDQTLSLLPADLLSVRVHTVSTGSAGPCRFDATESDVLRSL